VAEFVEAICISNLPYLAGEGFRLDGTFLNLTLGKKYKASIEGNWIRDWDDYDEDYLYPMRMFEVINSDCN
jgi:hypothetical protein